MLYANTHHCLFFPQPPIPLTPDFPATTIVSRVALSLSLSLQLAFSKRFDVSQQSLDLQKLRFDPSMADSSNLREGAGRGVLPRGRLGDGNVVRG